MASTATTEATRTSAPVVVTAGDSEDSSSDDATPTVTSATTNSSSTATTQEDDDCQEVTSGKGTFDDDYLDVGFMFDHHRETESRRFEWPLVGKSENTSTRRRIVRVSLQCIDEEPGAVQSGHYLWPAAELMVQYVISLQAADEPSLSLPRPPATIIELGAGCGLASLALLQVYQTSLQCVIVTDHDPGTLVLARNNYESTLEDILDASQTEDEFNAAINDIASIPVLFESVEWGNREHVLAIQELLSEHTVDESNSVDLVIATDVIYCPEVVRPLLETAAQLLSPTGRMLVSQSFAFDEQVEDEIDQACLDVGLQRTIVLQESEHLRIQQFQNCPNEA